MGPKPDTVPAAKLTMMLMEPGFGGSAEKNKLRQVSVPSHASVSVSGSAACAVDIDRAASASSIGAFISCAPIPLSKHQLLTWPHRSSLSLVLPCLMLESAIP